MSRVFVVLASWEPLEALFDRQVTSLSEQTFRDWCGVVVDDASGEDARRMIAERLAHEPRLRFAPQSMRVGFYRKFERGLALVPSDCDYVAFCDQDDRWLPQKLERQVSMLDASTEAQLGYCDLRLVDEEGRTIVDSFWSLRPHRGRFREVLYNNVVTGATAVFRRRLLDAALPFPDDPGGAFHDHWLALCAMLQDGLAYLDEPLVDYAQHVRNVLGAQALDHVGRGSLGRFLRGAVAHPREVVKRLNELGAYAVSAERRLCAVATALHSRFPTLAADREIALRPFLRSRRAARVFDLAGPTLIGSLLMGEETNLEPLKLSLGMVWEAVH